MMVSMLTFDLGRISAQLNEEAYTPAKIDYAYLKDRVESVLNPPPGALKFLSDFNLEKIEEKVEQYREKLLKDVEQTGLSAADIENL